MIFALLFILIFAGLVTFNLFGSQPNVATAKAQVFAQNMAIFHQAAMLQVTNDISRGVIPSCFPPCPAYPLNNDLLQTTNGYQINTTVNGQLHANWPEYQPIVPETISTGWQSFLLRGVTGTDASTPGTESYVLTVFRGFGNNGGNGNGNNNGGCLGAGGPAQSFGNMAADNFSLGLTKTVTERAGLGFLNCSGNGANAQCTFNRYATDGSAPDTPLQFSTGLLAMTQDGEGPPPHRYFFPPNAGKVVTSLNGCVAVMTHVNAN